MATPGSSFTPTPLGHEDNLERLAKDLVILNRGQVTTHLNCDTHSPNFHISPMGSLEPRKIQRTSTPLHDRSSVALGFEFMTSRLPVREKDELKIVAEELNLTVPEGAKIADLKSLIVNSDVYKNDKELVQSAIDYALAEIKNKRWDRETKLEFERIKLAQLQKQLELANIQKNLL
ncbi:hypothetical protein TNCV_3526321 [Trichonephila clavipes]|nr:hypothetical protein TNCV_3526321 [Trichonephila clavipes]